MSYESAPELVIGFLAEFARQRIDELKRLFSLQTSEANAINRVDSGETDESPFASNLVTPNEDQEQLHRGIQERFDVAKTILGYFGSQNFSGEGKIPYEDPCSEVVKLSAIHGSETKETSLGTVGDFAIGENLYKEEDEALDDQNSNLIGTLPSAMSSLSSSESIQRPRAGSFYNLPNSHIVAEDLAQAPETQENDDIQGEGPYGGPDGESACVTGPDAWPLLMGAIFDSSMDVFLFCLKVCFFLPWCVAVGGALIFSPAHLETLAFGTGYIEPLSGIRRYSHWATYGFHHVTSFFTLIGAIVWFSPSVGYLSIGALLAQFCFTWHGFLVDSTIPLGEDDRQTVYLLATTTWLNHDKSINIKEVGGSYYYSTRSLTTDSNDIDDSDEDCST